MRCVVCLLLGALLFSGCAIFKRKSNTNPPPKTPASQNIIVTPDNSRTGRVVSVNASGRFAVVNFPIGTVPRVGTLAGVYRDGLKVGELKITGLQSDENTVADITNGDAAAGDQVRTP